MGSNQGAWDLQKKRFDKYTDTKDTHPQKQDQGRYTEKVAINNQGVTQEKPDLSMPSS